MKRNILRELGRLVLHRPDGYGDGAADSTDRPRGERARGLAFPRRTPGPTISLTMIVRDEEINLPRCLESVRGLFHEIVVVDTGSTDRTGEVAEAFGARVIAFTWADDFAAARNEALAHSTGDYAFWLDADDVVDPPQRTKLRALLGRLEWGDEAGYMLQCATGRYAGGDEVLVEHIRLLPIRADVRWEHRVHEQVWPALERSNIPLRQTDITVRHTGYADPDVVARKSERNMRLLQKELEERPDEPHVLYYLGSLAFDRQDWGEALQLFQRGLLGASCDSIRGDFLGWIALLHFQMKDLPAALDSCNEALSVFPDEAGFWYFKAEVHRQRDEPAEAEACWRRVLDLRPAQRACGADPRLVRSLARRKLAVMVADRGDFAEAARLWSEVMEERPDRRRRPRS